MRLAVISDIHGNLEAFNAVLQDIRSLGLKKIICCGDSVNYCANPNEVVDILREEKIISVQGNHDAHSIDLKEFDKFDAFGQAGLKWTNKVLTNENKVFLSKLPQTYKGIVDERRVFFVHGSVDNPWWEYVYSNSDDSMLQGFLDKTKAHVMVSGHTHIPFVRRLNGRLFVNCGSVGQPRDHDNRSSYCILDTDSLMASIRRVEYDINIVSRKIISAGLPGYLAERLSAGR